jgi:hypothetical protein
MTDDWTASVLDSEGAIRMGRAVCVSTGAGAVVAGAILLANLIHGMIDGLGLLFVPAIPILVAGQLWAIAVLVARQKRVDRGEANRWSFRKSPGSRLFFFEGSPVRQANALTVIALVCVLIVMVSFLQMVAYGGGPVSPTRRCQYRLNLVSYGEGTCVSRSTYLAAGAAQQRLPAGVFAFFFVLQFGIAAAELKRRRVEASEALA